MIRCVALMEATIYGLGPVILLGLEKGTFFTQQF